MTTREFAPRLDRQITRISDDQARHLDSTGAWKPRYRQRVRRKSRYGPLTRRDFSMAAGFSQVVQGSLITISATPRYVVRRFP